MMKRENIKKTYGKITNKINPIAVVCSGLLFIPSLMGGLLAGLIFSLDIAILMSLVSAISLPALSYFRYSRVELSEENFFSHLSKVLSILLGFLWGGMSIGPILFMYGLSVLNTGSALLLGSFTGIGIFLGGNKFFKGVFGVKPENSVSMHNFGFISMIIAGCIGLMWGPLGWIVCSTIGLTLGVICGGLSTLIKRFNSAQKVLSGLFTISTTFIGVMLGAVIGVLTPIVSPIAISLFFGTAFMLTGSVVGITIGKPYRKLDITRPSLQHRLFQSVALLSTIFVGFLGGGLFGFSWLPVNSILVSQAIGMLVSGSFFGLVTASYYLFKNVFSKSYNSNSEFSSSPNIEKPKPSDAVIIQAKADDFVRKHPREVEIALQKSHLGECKSPSPTREVKLDSLDLKALPGLMRR